ncbi:MAG: IPT/TIG domain-containing protein [Gammaproteobacteria bacterium]|nr:IPT/TIG domain-containing protein [Gammaproteobacteria bacterium]
METTSLYLTMAGVTLMGFAGMAATGTVDNITPSKGLVGQQLVIHGHGFDKGPVNVTFGTTPASIDAVLNDNTIEVTIPDNKKLADKQLTVHVLVGGKKIGEKVFEYDSRMH